MRSPRRRQNGHSTKWLAFVAVTFIAAARCADGKDDGAPGTDVRRLTSDSAAKLATLQSPAVLAAASDLKAKAAELEAASLVWRPTLSLQNVTNYGRGDSTSFQAVQRVDEPGVPSGFAEGSYMSNSVVLALPLYYSGTWFTRETPAAVQAAANQAVAQENLKLEAAAAANLVVKAYFNALLATEQLAIYQVEHSSKLKQLNIVRERVAARLAPRSDQLLVEAALATALAGVNTSTSMLDTNLVQLRSLLGLRATEKLELAAVMDDVPAVPRLADLIDATVKEHPKVRLQQANMESARGALLKAKGDYSAVLTFTSSITGASSWTTSTSTPSFSSVGITLAVPISDFGQSDAKIRAKHEAVNTTEQQLEVARSTARRDLASAYHTLSQAKEQIAPAKAKLEQFLHAEEVTQARYDAGLVPLSKLLDDQYNVLVQRVTLLSLKYAAWGGYADLIVAAGRPYSTQGALP